MTKTKLSPAEGMDLLLTVSEIAALDHCSEKTVRLAIDAGLLEVIRIGPGTRPIRISAGSHAAYRARPTRQGSMSNNVQ